MCIIQSIIFNFSTEIAQARDMTREMGEFLGTMATLNSFDTAILVYCLHNGVSKSLLSRKFGKRREWMYQLAKRELQSVFPDEERRSWFNAGIMAQRIMHEAFVSDQEAETLSTSEETPLWKFSKQKREESARLILKRASNLRSRKDSFREIESQETEPAEQDDASSCSNDETNQEVANAILQDLSNNLAEKRKRAWRYSSATHKFAYIIRSYSNVCYDYLRKLFPLPSRQLLARKYRAVERELELAYENCESFEKLVTAYFDRHPLSHETERLQCSLSIDAFSMSVFQRCREGDAVCERVIDSMEDNFSGKMEVETQQVVHDEEEETVDPNRPCNNIFLIVLNPFRWDLPSIILSARPWRSGKAGTEIVSSLLDMIDKLKMYNIDVRAIASDGDSGYSCLHNAVYDVWKAKRNEDFFTIFNLLAKKASFKVAVGTCKYRIQGFPVADPLHACKIARSRFLEHSVYLTPAVDVSSQKFEWLSSHKWYCDRGQLARMNDYYALSMFSPETFIDCCKRGARELALYIWPWTALLLVIRVPFVTIDCRLSLLNASFLMFQFFLNKVLDGEFKGTGIQVRYQKGSKGVTFFETYYLIRVIHLIFALYGELLNGGHKLRLASFGSHINENIIGRIRVSCHGNSAFQVIMRVLAKTEMRRVMQWDLGVEHTVRGRDNVGGTKLDAHGTPDLEGLDFAALTNSMVKALDDGKLADCDNHLREISGFLETVASRKGEIFPVYQSNATANSGIMARLIRFVAGNKEPGTGKLDEAR